MGAGAPGRLGFADEDLVLALLLTTNLALAAGIYKWVDEDGQVHYSQRPPADTQAEQLKGAPPPADDPEAVRGDLQRQLDALDEQRAQRDEAFAEADGLGYLEADPELAKKCLDLSEEVEVDPYDFSRPRLVALADALASATG